MASESIIAETVSIQCRMYAVVAEIAGMSADNAVRALVNESPAHGADAFHAAAERLEALSAGAMYLASVARGL